MLTKQKALFAVQGKETGRYIWVGAMHFVVTVDTVKTKKEAKKRAYFGVKAEYNYEKECFELVRHTASMKRARKWQELGMNVVLCPDMDGPKFTNLPDLEAVMEVEHDAWLRFLGNTRNCML